MTIEALKQIFIQLGATDQQAERASKQLIKKAEQIAKDKSISTDEALKDLINKILKAQ